MSNIMGGRAQSDGLIRDMKIKVDKIDFIIYNKHRKRQDLKRLCHKMII